MARVLILIYHPIHLTMTTTPRKVSANLTDQAQFIGRFIENDTPWAHLDIAGVAWAESNRPYTPKGATGFGVTLLNQWIKHNHEQS